MSFIIRLGVLAAIIFGANQLYQSPQYRPQLEEAWKQLLGRFSQIEEQFTKQVGVHVNDIDLGRVRGGS